MGVCGGGTGNCMCGSCNMDGVGVGGVEVVVMVGWLCKCVCCLRGWGVKWGGW